MNPIRQITETLRSEIDLLLPKIDSHSIKVLYIDDEIHNLIPIKPMFRRTNITCYTAQTLEEGLKILSTEKVHILMTDLELPVSKGELIISTILAMYPHITPIVLSGHLTDERASKLESSFNGITLLNKPFDSNQLTGILKELFKSFHYTTLAH